MFILNNLFTLLLNEYVCMIQKQWNHLSVTYLIQTMLVCDIYINFYRNMYISLTRTLSRVFCFHLEKGAFREQKYSCDYCTNIVIVIQKCKNIMRLRANHSLDFGSCYQIYASYMNFGSIAMIIQNKFVIYLVLPIYSFLRLQKYIFVRTSRANYM